jgi:DNA-binding CsgD family transcriptional regulator
MYPLERILAVIVALLGALNTIWALSLPPAAHPPTTAATVLWALAIATHAALYWLGGRIRGRFGLWTYASAQCAVVFALGASGAPFGLTLALFIGLTATMTILLRDWVPAMVVTAISIALFAAASMMGSTLYQGASAGLVLAAVGVIAHSCAALLRQHRPPAVPGERPLSGDAAIPMANGPMPALSGLTEREVSVARILGTGARTSEIASELQITERTVKAHLSHIYQKLGVRSRAEVIALVQRHAVANVDARAESSGPGASTQGTSGITSKTSI